MIILGIDPGLAITGYGVIDYDKKKRGARLKEAGVVRTDPKSSISERLSKIYENVIDLIKEYAPEVIVLEKL